MCAACVAELSAGRIAYLQVLNGTLFAASTGRIDDRWRAFMQFQIARARQVRGAAVRFQALVSAAERGSSLS